jgi:Protein of unknown function (DUF4233)
MTGPVEPSDQPRGSGLRNPPAAIRGVGAGALAAEGLVLLLAVVPLRVLGAHLTGLAVTCVVVLAVLCFVLTGLLGRPWAWAAGAVIPVLLIVGGFVFHPSLAVIGLIFGLVWIYALYVRRSVLR